MNARDGRWVYTAGPVLVRQKPGSAKGVMFITIEDETGPANVVVWPTLFEKRRCIVLGSAMMAINGRIQREGESPISLPSNSSISQAIWSAMPIGIRGSGCRPEEEMSLPTVAPTGFTQQAEASRPARHVHTGPSYRYAESEEPEFSLKMLKPGVSRERMYLKNHFDPLA